jgi:hypothetical protein
MYFHFIKNDVLFYLYTYNLDGDAFIYIDDVPKATITFGLFRGSDRIIQWREVSN